MQSGSEGAATGCMHRARHVVQGLVGKDCHHRPFTGVFQCTAQGRLQFAVTADEDSASDSPVKMKLCGEPCEISNDMGRPGPWTAEKSSSRHKSSRLEMLSTA
ncbi:synaptotagmin-6 [Lates japonicus]|uniref:Synaptotagmin-6 n=1 Tax=Lates japonicus TaxID=270547 RepID=A0AAD3R0I1_LATJO|nr:synaptotagmin-6 [Lates japonicus]